MIANTGITTFKVPGTVVVANAQWALDNFGVIHFTNGGVLEVSGSTDDSFLQDGGTLSGPGALQFDSQAEVDLAGSMAILKGAAVILADGGDLGGEGTLNGPGSFEWTGGQIGNEGGGTVVWGPSLVVDFSGNAPKSLCAPVVSEATVTWSGGDLGTFGDEPGEISKFGTFNVAGDLTMSGSGSTFNNVEGGTLAKTSGAGDLSILSTWSVINGGVLDAKTGTISLQSDAANRFDKGAILEGEVQIQGQVSVPQNLFLTAGSTLQIAANSSLNPTLFSANDSDGGQTLIEGAGTLEWSAGAIGGDNSAGAITISTPLVIDNNAADGEVIGTGLITTTGATVTWVGDGGIFFQGVTWDNNDTFDIHSDTFINGPGGTLTNSGSIVKSKSPGITTIDMTTVNTGTVTIESGELLYPNAAFRAYTQTRGVTLLDGGALSNATQGALSDGGDEPRELDIFGGSLEGFGTATAELNIYGVLSPGNAVVPVGSLRVLGDLTIEDGGEVDIDLGGTDAGELDTIDVSGNATFDGTLVVRLTGGYQIPSSGARFVVMNYADEVGNSPTSSHPRVPRLPPPTMPPSSSSRVSGRKPSRRPAPRAPHRGGRAPRHPPQVAARLRPRHRVRRALRERVPPRRQVDRNRFDLERDGRQLHRGLGKRDGRIFCDQSQRIDGYPRGGRDLRALGDLRQPEHRRYHGHRWQHRILRNRSDQQRAYTCGRLDRGFEHRVAVDIDHGGERHLQHPGLRVRRELHRLIGSNQGRRMQLGRL